MKTLIWSGDYEQYDTYIERNPTQENVKVAAEQLRNYINIDHVPADDELIIVNVGGYDCVACRVEYIFDIKCNSSGVKIYSLVAPFDDNRAYPIQCAELKLDFKLY